MESPRTKTLLRRSRCPARRPSGCGRPALFPLLLWLGLYRMTGVALAQTPAPDTLRVTLPELRVEAARGAVDDVMGAPFAISRLAIGVARMDTGTDATGAAMLRSVPSVFASDRGHGAVGDRITVRGMGSRAGFGVRGVQLVLDGIPLTMPDGQAVTELIEPAVVRRIEVIRGPASRFWGNGSGGTIFFETFPADNPAQTRVRLAGDSYGSSSALIEAGIAGGRSKGTAWVSAANLSGYREHSDGRVIRFGGTGRVALKSGSVLRFMVAGADQDVLAPGGLTGLEAGENPMGADPRYVASSSGKKSTQVQLGASLLGSLGGGVVELSTFGVVRDLRNPLPFAWIGVDRRAGGARLAWSRTWSPIRLSAAVDAGLQSDARINAANSAGLRALPTTIDQTESVHTRSATVLVSTRGALAAHAGIRIDRVRMRLTDRLTEDGDQSDSRPFHAASPSLGVSFSHGSRTIYADWSTAFETPTTTELVNRADGLVGFNTAVLPQRTQGIEAGMRSDSRSFALDFAVYRLSITDLLASFESEVDGRTYYANAGEAEAIGVEGSIRLTLGERLSLSGSAMIQRFRFDRTGGSDRVVPGVPERMARLVVESNPLPRLRVTATLDARAKIFGDDANTFAEPGCVSVDIGADHTVELGSTTWRPFFAVRNLADARCAASIIPNARSGRYIEPAPGRAFAFGITFRR